MAAFGTFWGGLAIGVVLGTLFGNLAWQAVKHTVSAVYQAVKHALFG